MAIYFIFVDVGVNFPGFFVYVITLDSREGVNCLVGGLCSLALESYGARSDVIENNEERTNHDDNE